MADYRDPKVTTGAKRESNTTKWIGIAVAVLVVLLLIAWFTGAFDGGEEVAPVVDQPTTEGTTGGTVAPATEGTAPATEEPATQPAQQ